MCGSLPMKKQLFNEAYSHYTGLVLRMTEKVSNYKKAHACKSFEVMQKKIEEPSHKDNWMVQWEISDKQLIL